MTRLNYKVETVTVTFAQKQALKMLATSVGAPANPVDVPACLRILRDAGRAAGGDAPLPLPPSTADLEVLLGKFGAEQQVAVADQVPSLVAQWETWQATAKTAAVRLLEWHEARSLLRHSEVLPTYGAGQAALDAIETQRSLLADPNPLTAILARLRSDLRAGIQAAHDHAAAAREAAVDKLKATPQWVDLPESESVGFLNQNGLAEPELPDVADDTHLIDSLERRSLSARNDQADAFAGKAGPAIIRLIEQVTPKAIVVHPKPGLIVTEQEADEYLAALRITIVDALVDGNPVSIY
jgi:hypothetical protein